MDMNQQKEQFSIAYARAVVAAAGFICYTYDIDVDSIDIGISGIGGVGTAKSPKIEIQLKCTARDIMFSDGVRYPLKIKNYNELRGEDYPIPRLLVVVVVPEDINEWLLHSEDELSMRHCGYWMSLRGFPETDNKETITVTLPRTQQFNVNDLCQIMERISNGGLP
ncbi:MAG: DUF4365 domain-containing protein [Candidatus Magnetobacterium sp. LHC-1]|uniref:DUF4365 domain-containing protein n=1 Tax=Candidatus Magnetobacterium casense TaxID=1455061 RepID=A0ABS6RUK0_9BACT|nr:DUF4365 domain-containing protein [Candidatus Magnetobacterium casensis]MBF0606482.1 DUF4365 domain-containing protein [Nitrospirota bacterium]MBV6340306.1 DUF4365 domain-containing protein [Candidatus Magnetobacterium casensis]